MNLETLASYAEIVGLITILGAAVYSWFQIKEMKAHRLSAAAISLSEHFHRPGFVDAIVEMVYQPDSIDTIEKLKEYHGERWPEIITVMTTWESMGALVHRGDLDFHLVYDLYSGLIVATHNKCLPMISNEREKFAETRFEWFTWLADRITEFKESEDSLGAAHIEFANWQPPAR